MQTVTEVPELRRVLATARARGERIALVPTMGNLHAGHAALLRRARAEAAQVVASLFVNPFQFGPGEDFSTYPRTPDSDRALLEAEGVDVLLQPGAEVFYPRGPQASTRVQVPELGDVLCGRSRPGFFRGVATVVAMLFNMVQPDLAVFGEKDYQQLLVVRRMAADLHMPVRIESVPTARAADGLALSSRNAYLAPEDRARAPGLYRVLRGACAALRDGRRDYEAIEAEGMDALATAGFRPDYVAVRRAADLRAPAAPDDPLVVLGAAWLGATRLIDNLRVA